jgi:hypothetical protein
VTLFPLSPWEELLLLCLLAGAALSVSGCSGCPQQPVNCDTICPKLNTPQMVELAKQAGIVGGSVFCLSTGRKCACLLDIPQLGYAVGVCADLDRIGLAHEQGHLSTAQCPPGNKAGPAMPPRPGEECEHRTDEIASINAAIGGMNSNCQAMAKKIIKAQQDYINVNCPGSTK